MDHSTDQVAFSLDKNADPATLFRTAAVALKAAADKPENGQGLRDLYSAMAMLLEKGIGALMAVEIEAGVLRIERDGALARAAACVETADQWFNRAMAAEKRLEALGAVDPQGPAVALMRQQIQTAGIGSQASARGS